MLGRLLNFADMPKYLDATDALAVAYCHFLQKDIPEVSIVGKPRKPKAKSWASFLTENPDRVK
jgi:crossover junction endodeoxyribonuclease RuvC